MTRRLWRNERGLTTVEYVVVLCLIAALAVSSWQAFGDSVAGWLQRAGVRLQDNLGSSEKPAR